MKVVDQINLLMKYTEYPLNTGVSDVRCTCRMERGPLGAGIINLANVSQPVFGLKAKQIKGLLWWVFL